MDAPPPPRWIVGIDLGTTNCSVACIDSAAPLASVEPFLIEQLIDWNMIERRRSLPSFHYVPSAEESNGCSSKWMCKAVRSNYVVGTVARDLGSLSPSRLTTSAKSWLCHRTADRTAAILPWHGDPEIDLISPVVASSRYLEHIRCAWNSVNKGFPLENCDVILTLPASFDEVARELTLQAATLAGLQNVTLIEEPQAAFYAWLETAQTANTKTPSICSEGLPIDSKPNVPPLDAWQETIKPGQTVVVCDIGGGTTDFTLIRVKADTTLAESLQKFGLHRVAVGQHLILGGDNLDVAITKVIEPMLTGSAKEPLPIRQWELLRHQCRLVKERLLQDDAPETDSVSILGSGSRLIGNTRSVKVSKATVVETVLEGYFPKVLLSDRPARTYFGLVEFGLHYENEPAITKHLASFLWDHRWDGRSDLEKAELSQLSAARPDWILFNGGVLESSLIRQRLVDQINDWFPDHAPIGILPADRLDVAVAIGAAYFGLAKRGLAVRINANLARSYYLQISDSPARAVCVMPADSTPLNTFRLANCQLTLSLGQPVQLPIFVSSTNLIHHIGDVVDVDPLNMTPMAPLATVLASAKGRKHHELPVIIESSLSEIGTLELALIEVPVTESPAEPSSASDPPGRWRLAFDLRGLSDTSRQIDSNHLGNNNLVRQATLDQTTIHEVTSMVKEAFASNTNELSKTLITRISQRLDQPRETWSLSVLRAIWQSCIECEQHRTRSIAMESRWLNTIGYCLRPGYGFVSDDWRVATTWRTVRGKLRYPGNASESLILWRRIAGGFTQGQQRAIYQEMQGKIRGVLSGETSKIRSIPDVDEFLRMAGSLELVHNLERASIGSLAIESLNKQRLEPFLEGILWMIGRMGSRAPVYAPVNTILPTEMAERWLSQLLTKDNLPIRAQQRTILSLARKTGDRYRDISPVQQSRVCKWLQDTNAPASYVSLVEFAGQLSSVEQEILAGDSLPLGVRLSE